MTQFSAIHGTSDNDVWAGGWDGLVHFDGTKWREFATPFGAGTYEIIAIRALTPTDVWFATSGEVWRLQDGRWHSLQSQSWVGLWSGGKDAVWGVSDIRVVRCLTATEVCTPVAGSPMSRPLSAIAGTPSGVVWAAGDGVLLSIDGAAWSEHVLPDPTFDTEALWARDSGVWLFGGADGKASTTMSLQGTTWTDHGSAGGSISTAWGTTDERILAGGEVVALWDAGRWAVDADFAQHDFRARGIWASPSGTTWLAGYGYEAGGARITIVRSKR